VVYEYTHHTANFPKRQLFVVISRLYRTWNAIHFEPVINGKVSGCKVNRAIPDAEQLTPKNDELNAKMQKAQPVKAGLFDAADVLAPRPGLEPGTCGLTVRRSTD